MNGEILRLVDGIHRDKSIEKEVIFQALEAALQGAAKKRFGAHDTTIIRIDRETGNVVVEGRQNISPADLGRIAAQSAKQLLIQKVREAERTQVLSEIESKKMDVVIATVVRVEGNMTVVNIGKTEAILPRREQLPGENLRIGDTVRAYLTEVRKKGQKLTLVLSRTHPNFVARLFELEVPEMAEGAIEVKALSREPGYRTKIAVSSTNPKIDAVGACVGVRGNRIKGIVEELNGERVDIIPWDDLPENFVRNALKPAEVVSVLLHEKTQKATVYVNRDRLSLAIGRGGQNVRLASRMTGWDIDVVCTDEAQAQAEALAALPEMNPDWIALLRAVGVHRLTDLVASLSAPVAEFLGTTSEVLDALKQHAAQVLAAAREAAKAATVTAAAQTEAAAALQGEASFASAQDKPAEPREPATEPKAAPQASEAVDEAPERVPIEDPDKVGVEDRDESKDSAGSSD